MVGRKNKKPFVAPAGWQKRRKVENPPRYHSSLFPVLETHSTGYHHIPATVTGAPVCIYFQFDAAAVQPVRQLDRAVPRTNRHFSERIALLTTLCHCVCDGWMIANRFAKVNGFFPEFSFFIRFQQVRSRTAIFLLCEVTMQTTHWSAYAAPAFSAGLAWSSAGPAARHSAPRQRVPP